MKTMLCFTLTLLIFATLAFVLSSFAQDAVPEYIVRVIYFIPNDRQPDPDIDTKLDTLMKDAQQFYADQMEAHGFERKTFRFEADDASNVVVHHVNGKFDDAYYQNPTTAGMIWAEIEAQFDMQKNIYFLALDISSDFLAGTTNLAGGGGGNSLNGKAIVPVSRVQPRPWENPTDFHNVVFHELGHTFGLLHDFRSNPKLIFSSPYMQDRMITSFCAAEWLDVHRYFNSTQKLFNQNTEIQMLTPSLASPPNVIHFRFEVTDPDGLHQIQLFHQFYYTNSDIDPLVMTAYQQVQGKKTTVEIVSTQLMGVETKIYLQVIDVHGNFMGQSFPIDIHTLLPGPETILIPDPNLKRTIRKTLGLAPENTITQLDILKLKILGVRKHQIATLTGLEHARNLIVLDCEDNQIGDINPLIGLTNLKFLNLGGNQISDVTVFSKIPSLVELQLWENPIEDRAPLLALLRQNPNIKIYLMEEKEPLPVTLSHFRAEHTTAGVVLKWTTESELDNAGFNILRSETKDGEFKPINSKLIQGAGTTSERHTYTWTDTTAKPNVVYYYQIEDISHAGDRKQLATVRMRGYVSAAGKLTTKWGDLKRQE